jgi:hypothetical protein
MRRSVRGEETPSALAAILRFRIAAIFAAQLFDFGTFARMVERHGIRAEANPIVAHGFIAFGLPLVALVKIALVILVGSAIVILGRKGQSDPRSMRLAAIVVVVAVIGGLIGGISNTAVH